MYGYVYMTTNLLNNKKYIGQHRSSSFDAHYKGSGKLLLKAIDKYGVDNFKTEIIEECDSKDSLDAAEIRLIQEHNAVESEEYYNIAKGGSTGSIELMLEAARKPDVRKRAAKNIVASRIKRFGTAAPWLNSRESARKRYLTRLENGTHPSFKDKSQRDKAKLGRINKYGSSTAHMMTKEIRAKASKSKSYILEYDGKEFIGYKTLKEYIDNKFDINISNSSLVRLSQGLNVIKYNYLTNKIIIKSKVKNYIPTNKD